MSGDPAAPPAALAPRPRRRLGARVLAVLDWVTAALCAVIIYGVLFHGQVIYRLPYVAWEVRAWLPPLLAIALSFPVAIRRRDPLLALALVLAGCVVTMAFGGMLNRGPVLPLAIVLYLVAARCPRTIAIAGLAVSLWLLAAQALILHWTGLGPGDAIGSALTLIIVWMTGVAVQQRRAYAARLREQVASAAVTGERLRIARELHDVVAHSMTVVAVQAGFGEYVFEQDPGEARAALGAIQRVTREALADMQRLLGVLRQDGTGQPAGGQALDGEAAGATLARAGRAGRTSRRRSTSPRSASCRKRSPTWSSIPGPTAARLRSAATRATCASRSPTPAGTCARPPPGTEPATPVAPVTGSSACASG